MDGCGEVSTEGTTWGEVLPVFRSASPILGVTFARIAGHERNNFRQASRLDWLHPQFHGSPISRFTLHISHFAHSLGCIRVS